MRLVGRLRDDHSGVQNCFVDDIARRTAVAGCSSGDDDDFTPCPNPFREAPMFACSLTNDSYSLTLYALSEEKLTEMPAPDMDAATGMPVAGSNWGVNMAHYIE